MNKTINELQDEIVEEFSYYEDWMEKYQRIIELGKEVPLIDEQYKTDENLIRGCQSSVWLHSELQDGKIIFTADSDAIITKGLIALIIQVLSGQQPKDILAAEIYFIDKIGLHNNLSPTRSNGLRAMVQKIRVCALSYKSPQSTVTK